MKRLSIYSLCIFLFTACSNSTAVDTKAESERLMQASRDWSKEAGQRNAEKVLRYWQDDAIMISPGQPTLRGKQAISEMVKGSFTDSSFKISWEPVSAEVSNDGSMGYIIETTAITMKDSTGIHTQNFNAVTIWKKTRRWFMEERRGYYVTEIGDCLILFSEVR